MTLARNKLIQTKNNETKKEKKVTEIEKSPLARDEIRNNNCG